MKRLTLTSALLLSACAPLFSAELRLSPPPGARANAMGTAFSTVAQDAYAIFYNPANLTTLTNLETRFETARRLSPSANKGETSLAYVRPWPEKQSRVYGFGYHAVRSQSTLSMDSLTFVFGDRTTVKYFQQPIFYGGGVKLVSLRSADKTQLGLGADAGVQIANNSGLKTAVVLSDILLGIGTLGATLTVGNSYTINDVTILADFRARGSYSELYFGAEYPLFNRLLQARAGKGIAVNGGDYLALGLGINTLPWLIDMTFSIPVKGYGSDTGYYGVNLGYRFGASGFSENLVGDAARKVESLKAQAAELRVQKANLEDSINSYRVNKGTLETELTLMQSRAREMEQNLRDLQLRTLDARYTKEQPKSPRKAAPLSPVEKWPRLHKVAAGETLRSIASQYYGNPNLWERVYEANEKGVSKGLPVEGEIFTIPPPPPSGKQ